METIPIFLYSNFEISPPVLILGKLPIYIERESDNVFCLHDAINKIHNHTDNHIDNNFDPSLHEKTMLFIWKVMLN